MAKVIKSASRTVRVISSSPVSGSMTVGELRDFVRALDSEGITDEATLVAERDHNTGHFIRLRTSVTTKIEEQETR
ncbi:hypothetical protein E1091_01595 [Micromonospora fluostatini]|uniref:Dodecin domain-containing protein n=1 Tax=Micromonospora fluostatini TaxID=1629071 RepID=A0ABY2DM65_9ACTN|nr:hypothetical protein E1091_01595 [Micromonospora fluostatini]